MCVKNSTGRDSCSVSAICLRSLALSGQSGLVRRVAIALLLVAAACGDSGSPASPQVIATSSTTAEEARAIDGPVMRYQDRSSTSGKLATLLQGVLQLDGDCLYLVQSGIEQRFPILWPADTRWDGGSQSVVSRVGEVMPIGGPVEGRGGYFYLTEVGLLAGSSARNLAAECEDNGQIAVVENTDSGIGPKGT